MEMLLQQMALDLIHDMLQHHMHQLNFENLVLLYLIYDVLVVVLHFEQYLLQMIPIHFHLFPIHFRFNKNKYLVSFLLILFLMLIELIQVWNSVPNIRQ